MVAYSICHKLQSRRINYASRATVSRYLSLLVASQFGCLYFFVKITAQQKQMERPGNSSVDSDEEETDAPHLFLWGHRTSGQEGLDDLCRGR
jgi:hypothetical protein